MAVIVGDRDETQPKNVHAPGRTGTIEAVLADSTPRYQVRWDDGSWSMIAPTDGALRVLSSPARSKPTTRRRASTRPA
jgi:hypothetical protein